MYTYILHLALSTDILLCTRESRSLLWFSWCAPSMTMLHVIIISVIMFPPYLWQTIVVKIITYKKDYKNCHCSWIINNSFPPITSIYYLFSLQHYSRHLAHTADTPHHTYRRRQELPVFVTDNFHVSTNKLNFSLYYLPVIHLHPKQHDIFIFSRGRITWREFPVIKARKLFCIVNSLTQDVFNFG